MATGKSSRIPHNFQDLTGKRFFELVVVSRAASLAGGVSQWLCKCDCGTEKVIRGQDLRTGATKSCGCRRRRVSGNKNRTHGLTGSIEYRIWQAIIKRCESPKYHAYKDYGGRGIKVCDRWRHSFETFLLDMGKRPADMDSIDRLNTNGDYEPGNCRWVTWLVQQNNRRNNRYITHNDKTQTLSEWAREFGISPHTLFDRLKRGIPFETAISTPVRVMSRRSKMSTEPPKHQTVFPCMDSRLSR